MKRRPKSPRSITLCAFPDCGRPHDAKGYCGGHYRQLAAGKELRPIVPRGAGRSPVNCERCGHSFSPRSDDHQNRCVRCRGRFSSDLAKVREKSRTAPEGKRWCRGCEKYRSAKFFSTTSARCKPCNKKYVTERRAQKVYSMGAGVYDQLYEAQGGRCAICQRATGASRSLSVDHDHRCCPGKNSCGECVRGLLCGGCNYKILGHLRDDVAALQRAIDYLNNPPARRVLTGSR